MYSQSSKAINSFNEIYLKHQVGISRTRCVLYILVSFTPFHRGFGMGVSNGIAAIGGLLAPFSSYLVRQLFLG